MPGKAHERLESITHKGYRIVVEDYRGMRDEALIDQLQQNRADIVDIWKREGSHPLLIMADITGAILSPTVIKEIKSHAQKLSPYAKATAVVGIVGILKVLFDAVKKFSASNLVAFEGRERAKDWLVEQASK